MEYGNHHELNTNEELNEDAAMRRLLMRYDQPASIVPPPDLSARILANIPSTPPVVAAATVHRRQRLNRVLSGAIVVVLASLLSLGVWGIFGDSTGPARLLGSLSADLGQIGMFLVLAAKPLVLPALNPGLSLLAPGVLIIIGIAWLWWYLVRSVPIQVLHTGT